MEFKEKIKENIFTSSVLLIISIPSVAVIILMFSSPHFIAGDQGLNAPFFWSLAGTFLSYCGLIFSSYAVYELRIISKRAYYKIRAPEICRELDDVINKMNLMHLLKISECERPLIITKIPTILISIKRFDNKALTKNAEDLNTLFNTINDELNKANKSTIISTLNNYWIFYENISTMLDEIREYNKHLGAL
ncbi:hypothetical protein [Acetobacter thailandicus]|uniref:hypothetical protein n=1 Tax=Acetobacter thailandicus TaxID=1502842 RepID=UPI001BAAFEAF|nr:hypothetical protein [Acetobacter thailandicus]MBS1003853.1 hypothetical protein [Acetobacter thailandicus]